MTTESSMALKDCNLMASIWLVISPMKSNSFPHSPPVNRWLFPSQADFESVFGGKFLKKKALFFSALWEGKGMQSLPLCWFRVFGSRNFLRISKMKYIIYFLLIFGENLLLNFPINLVEKVHYLFSLNFYFWFGEWGKLNQNPPSEWIFDVF